MSRGTKHTPDRRKRSPNQKLQPSPKRATFLHAPLLLVTCFLLVGVATAAWGTSDKSSKKKSASTPSSAKDNKTADSTSLPRRHKYLDHWDAETLATYLGIDRTSFQPLSTSTTGVLDTYAGYDASVLFYAQWCNNCHALAPLWDQIATLMKAGTTESNIIMSLFDCEKDEEHSKLCSAAGVTHYPTVMYIGAGPYYDKPIVPNPKNKNTMMAPLRRTAIFRGNWTFGEALVDWLNAMKGLSSWHKFSRRNPVMKFMRSVFTLPFLKDADDIGRSGGKERGARSLPVGVPHASSVLSPPSSSTNQASSSSGSGSDASATPSSTDQVTEQEVKDALETVKHTKMLLESTLLPSSIIDTSGGINTERNETDPTPDVFFEITQYDYWNTAALNHVGDNNYGNILRTCMMDLSLDYCSRVSTKVGDNALNKEVEAIVAKHADDLDAAVVELKQFLTDKVGELEPFCTIFDKCLAGDFAEEECQVKSCPFENDVACKYLSSCLIPGVQQEYSAMLSSS
mmetsp:Transcript_41949/g.48989  ORF Transcript_41949/g.48989 Transcript_41949/m.48989 type:complete len:513 (+) Transcript_41949:209-1747(+)